MSEYVFVAALITLPLLFICVVIYVFYTHNSFTHPKLCEECFAYYAEPGEDICVGCQAYKEHTAVY